MSNNPVLNLQGIKSLFTKGMNYVKDNFDMTLVESENDLCQYQIQLAEKSKDLNTLMNAIFISNSNKPFITYFKNPKEICTGCELANTKVHFGYASVGWYFIFGIAGNLCFNFSFFRQEIAPPKIVESEKIDPSEAVRWNVSGGFGTIGENPVWYSSKGEWLYLKYTENNYSSFSLIGTSDSGNTVVNFFTDSMLFDITVNFTDTNSLKHNLNIKMKGNTPPLANFPNACQYCFYDIGNFYYSYPTMDIIVKADNLQEQMGESSGWIDHQFIKNTYPNNLTLRALTFLFSNVLENGWLWFAIQDNETRIQYMLTVHYKDTYIKSIKIGEKLEADTINVYREGVPYYKPTNTAYSYKDCEIVLLETIKTSHGDLPSKYSITLPGGKKTILKINTAPNIYENIAIKSYETPAFLYDSSEKNIIGTGLIEANLYISKSDLSKNFIDLAGGNSTDKNQYDIVYNALNRKPTAWHKFLAILILLFPVLLIFLAILFILYKKENRKPRIGIAVCLLLLCYALVY